MASTNLPNVGAAGGFGSSSGSNAFLESTRTNVVVLQDLEGLCWRRYTLAPIGYGLSKNPGQQHALLSAFTRAIEAGYPATVVHRSSRSGSQSPHFGSQMDQQMDLYIFWQQQGGTSHTGGTGNNTNKSNTHTSTSNIGNTTNPALELPPTLSTIMSSVSNCKVAEEGCWDKGMSYAVRCLLMKATNCLVQAQLARGGYYRIGRYFVRTQDGNSSNGNNSSSSSGGNQQQPQHTIAFTLNYFVHGDGRQLCAFVNARRRPPLTRLSARHLANSNNPENTNVILCPFGLSGHLTGKALTGSEASDFLNLFAHTCPVVPSSSESTGLPSVVEVAIAGGAVHTFYPTHSLLVVDNGKTSETTENCGGNCTATSSPTQRRVPDTPRMSNSATSTHSAPRNCGGESKQPLGINILDLMSSGSDVSTHPSVLPSPNCACALSLTGKRTNTSSASYSAAKRPSFHRSCHLKAEEAVPSPLLSLSTQTNEEMSLLFPPLSVAPGANLPAPMDQQQNDDCRSTVSAKNCVDSFVEPKFPVPAEQHSSSSATTLTTTTVVTTAAPAGNNVAVVNVGGQISPTMGGSGHDIVPRKVWPAPHDREMLQRTTSTFSPSSSKNGGFMFGKAFQHSTNFHNDSSYILSMAFAKFMSNAKSENEDLVSLFGYDSLSCMAEFSPVKLSQNDHQHSRLGELGGGQTFVNSHQNHHQRNHSSSHLHTKSGPHHQQHQSSLATLLDSPDMSEPLSVDRNRGENATNLDILATLGHSNNRIGAELPDNIFDVDSDASDNGGNETSPGIGSGQGNGSSAPNSLDAHFPTPPTSVETNAPPSLRGLTPAAASETDHQTLQTQQMLGQNGSTLTAQQGSKQNCAVDDPFSTCETVFHPEMSCAFVEGERYRPLTQLTAISSNADDMISIGSSSTLISLKSLRHEPSKSKSLTGTPMKQIQPQQQVLNSAQRDQPMSPLSFLNSLGGGGGGGGGSHSVNAEIMGTAKSPEPNCLSQASPKNFETLVPDNLVSLLLHMSDSVLDIHRDVNFDMAPLCACANSPMRGVDWPAYLRSNVDAEDASMSTDGYPGAGGADTPWPGPIAECSCGYSAVVNRRFASFGCGLLRDDEYELLSSNATLKTVMKFAKNDWSSKIMDSSLIRLLQKMCSVASPPVPFVAHIARLPQSSSPWTGSKGVPNGYHRRMSVADKNSDLPMCRCRTCFAESLEVNSVFMSVLMGFLESDVMDNVGDEDCYFFHNWMNTGTCFSLESSCSTGELFRILSNIHPLLVSAFRGYPEAQNTHGGHGIGSKHARDSNFLNGDSKAGIPASVANAGPLQLLSLFESGSDTVATAVPIPFVMASCEKEAIQLAPTALGPCWERNGLEPVAGAGRRLCYFSVRPSSLPADSNFDDEEQIETLALKYFINEVGRVMVDCRLASAHTPLVEATFPFTSHQPSQYAQKVPRMPILVADSTAMDNSPATPNRAAQHANAQRDWLRTVQKMIVDSLTDREQLDKSYDGCVCYVVVRDLTIACQVLRLFSHLLDALPSDDFRERVVLQMVPTSFAALSWSSAQSAIQAEVRRLAFSIYTQLGSRWRLDRGERALTDTGPLPIMRDIILTESRLAAASDRKPIKYSPENASGLFEGPLRWPNSPIAVLARMKDQQTRLAECCGQKADTTVVVFAAYCPTPDQRFLLVSLTDDCGYIVKTGVLALEQQPPEQVDQQPPSVGRAKKRRTTRMRPPVARAAVERVWCWLLGAITHSSLAVPIRVVLTRLGRLGHGEVRTWSALMSRQSLLQMSSRLQTACNHCQALPSSEVPCVISSCLISLEPHPWLRLMSSSSQTPVATAVMQGAGLSSDLSTASFAYSGEFRTAGKLFTCTGSSAYSSTHVFAFPTSAAIQAQTQAVADEVLDSDKWDLLFPVDIDKDILDIPTVPSPSAGGGLMGFDDLNFGGLSASGPHQQSSRQNSAAGGWPRQSIGGESGGGHNVFGASASNFFGVDSTASTGAVSGGGAGACGLLQQPLAVAFVVSSAPMGPSLPEWLCTIVRNAGNNDAGDEKQPQTGTTEKPSALRAALHVHTGSILPTASTGAGGLNAGGLGSGGSTSGGATHGGAGGTGSGSVNMTLQEHPLDSRHTVDVLRYAVEEHDALSWLAVDPATGQRMSCLPPHIVALINLHHMLHVFSR